jgi:hypothetical protein
MASQQNPSTRDDVRLLDPSDVADVRIDMSSPLQLISVVDNTKRIVESLKAAQNQAQNPGVPVDALTPIDEVERVALPATQEHKEVSEFIVSPNAKFKTGDLILGKHEDHGDKLFAGMVMAPLATLFKEVDADGDDKLSFDEWRGRLGKLVSEKALRKLFDECDTDKNGTLDLEEFTLGLANKYEIKWAQEPQTDGIKDANEICLAPDPDLYRQEVASQKEAKERQLQQIKALEEVMKSLKPPQEGSSEPSGLMPLMTCTFVLALGCFSLLALLVALSY